MFKSLSPEEVDIEEHETELKKKNPDKDGISETKQKWKIKSNLT